MQTYGNEVLFDEAVSAMLSVPLPPLLPLVLALLSVPLPFEPPLVLSLLLGLLPGSSQQQLLLVGAQV